MMNVDDRVRTRAFFLWEKRTGRRWWDPVSNWLEAHARESGPRRALWPCTMHFDRVEPVTQEAAGAWSEKAIHRWELAELEALRAAYDRACLAATDADYVCAFACGGAPLLFHVCEAESVRRFGVHPPPAVTELEFLQSRFHLFSGLSWSDGRGTAEVHEFLNHVPEHARVLVLDCSFTGGAIAAIANVLAPHKAGRQCHVYGIVDASRLNQTKVAPAREAFRSGHLASLDLDEVPNLLSEDFPALLGYDRMQEVDPAIRAIWTAGAISIHDPTSGRYHVVSSIPVYPRYRSLLLAPTPIKLETAAGDHRDTCANITILTLLNAIDAEYDRARDDLADRDPYGFYLAKRDLCARFMRDAIAVAKHFQLDRSEISRPDFCDDLPREKQFFEGNSCAIELSQMDDDLIVSIRAAFRDGRQRQRSELSFRISRCEIEDARSKGLTLEEVARDRLEGQFDEMWAQQTTDRRQELELHWNQLTWED